MSQFNLAGLRQRVLIDKLEDEDYEAEVVDNFLNDTLMSITNQYELPFQEKIFQGVIPAGSTIFALPNDLALMQSQSMSGVPRFQQMKARWRDFLLRHPDAANQEPGAPSEWCLYGGNILLSKPTDQEYTLTMFYVKKPEKMVEDTDVPDFPYEFEELLVLGAYRRVLDRNEDNDVSQEIEAQYQAQLVQLVTRYGMREADGPIKMRNRQIVRK